MADSPPQLPIPSLGPAFPAWGSQQYDETKLANGTATLLQLVAWGENAPAPLQLNPVERIALAYYGGFVQCAAASDDPAWAPNNSVIDIHTATKDADYGRWGNAAGDGLWHGVALSWATNPTAWKVVTTVDDASAFHVVVNGYGALEEQYPAEGIDATTNGNAATAMNLYVWGNAVPPAMRLTDLELRAIVQKGNDAGWCKMQGPSGTGINQLTDPRFAKNADGTWVNRNHPDVNLGLVSDVASEPQHGVSGFIDAIVHDVEHDPLGALLFIVVAVSAAALLPVLLGALQVVTVVAAATGNLGNEASALEYGATHVAEVGRVVAGAELAVAGAVIGAKGIGALGGELAGSGVGEALEGEGVATSSTSSSSSSSSGVGSSSSGPSWWSWWSKKRGATA